MADINRGTIPAAKATEIITNATEQSAIMSLARRMDIPGNGQEVKVLLSEASAAWVAETEAKPVSNPTMATKTLKPSKLAFIETFSKEYIRDYDAIYNQLVERAPASLAYAFDQTVMGAIAAPDSNFDTFASAGTAEISTGTYGAIVGADGEIATAGGQANGIASSPALRSVLLGATDTTGRPLFIPTAMDNGNPLVLGFPTVSSRGIANGSKVGVIGDWTKAIYGMTGGIEVSITEQATVKLADDTEINLWQQNMFAVRVEVAVGFIVADNKYFKVFTNTAG